MASDILREEFEVLESIYHSELSKFSETAIKIETEPDDLPDGAHNIKLKLCVIYPKEYPDVFPELSIEVVEGDLDDSETEEILTKLHTLGEESLGMAMTFTLVSYLRELLSELVRVKIEKAERLQKEKERLELEAEMARTRGTPVTIDTFKAWKIKFLQEMVLKKIHDDDERLKNLAPKEKEEYKRFSTRLSGRQLFEHHKVLEDENLLEEDAVSIDVSTYDRIRVEEVSEDEGIRFSDSD